MNTLKEILDGMKHDDEKEIIEALREYYDTDEEFLQAIIDDDDISDNVSQYADGEVDIYTGRVYAWIADNFKAVSEYEGEAIGTGADTIEKIGQMCQYMQAEANAREALASARKALEDDTQEALEAYEKAESDLMDQIK